MKIYVGIPGSKEFYLKEESFRYFYDFTIPRLKICIEYNGEHVHPNPEWLEEDIERWNKWRHFYSHSSSDVIYKKDKNKIDEIINCGYKTLIIWFETNIDKNIYLCKKFILDNLNK